MSVTNVYTQVTQVNRLFTPTRVHTYNQYVTANTISSLGSHRALMKTRQCLQKQAFVFSELDDQSRP